MDIIPDECEDALKSKSAIDRAGDFLVALAIPSNNVVRDVRCYRWFRLSSLYECIRNVVEAELPSRCLLSARLKRLAAISRKLAGNRKEAGSMHLSQMDDIIGIRVVCENYFEAQQFSARLQGMRIRPKLKDYAKNPRNTGYRAIHHIFKIEQSLPNKKLLTFPYEVQVRSHYQNLWATWSESHSEETKAGRGPDKIHKILRKTSKNIQEWEDEHPRARQIKLPEVSRRHNLVLVKRREYQAPTCHFFEPDEWEDAFRHLLYWEMRSAHDDPDALLLAGLSSPNMIGQALEKTHPTYFYKVVHPKKWMPGNTFVES